jgi:hypothetical protein
MIIYIIVGAITVFVTYFINRFFSKPFTVSLCSAVLTTCIIILFSFLEVGYLDPLFLMIGVPHCFIISFVFSITTLLVFKILNRSNKS